MSNHSPTSSPVAINGFDPRLVRYGSIFLLIVGTFGNIVSFIIFSYGTLRRSSTFRYLALLSLMDLVVLYSGLLDLFLMVEYRGTHSIRSINPISCRLHTFITYWSQHSSSWILSFISVDRAVATNCIKFARKFCTPRSANYIVAIILMLIAIFNCHELIFLHIQDHISNQISIVSTRPTLINNILMLNNKKLKKRTISSFITNCDKFSSNIFCSKNRRQTSLLNITTRTMTMMNTLKPKTSHRLCEPLTGSHYAYFWDHVWEWIDVCLYAIIPFFVMCIGTFFIVYRVYYQQRRVFRSRRSNQNNSIGAVPNRAKSLFYLLFTLNLLYFILVSPVVLVTTILFRDQDEELAYPRFKAIIYLMQYCNHSLNFIFYGITSPPYRRTLCEWFEQLVTHLPICCQQRIPRRSKAVEDIGETTKRLKNHSINIQKKDGIDSIRERTQNRQELISLVPRNS